MTQLSSLGFVIISLEKDVVRREQLQSSLAELGATDVHVIRAVDGEELAARQGRSRKAGPRRLRLSYNAEDGSRVQSTVRMPRRSATLNPWAILGCSLSHALALEYVNDRFRRGRREPMIVLEDDACLAGTAQQSSVAFSSTMAALNAAVPDWTLVHLGGVRVDNYAKHTRNRPSTMPGLGVSEAIYQTHAYMLSHASAAACLGLVMEKLKDGFPSDAALNTWTRRNYETCFYFRPFLFMQGDHGSSIVLVRERPETQMHGNHTLAQTARRLMGPAARAAMKRSGQPKIDSFQLRAISGRAGGAVKAGGASSRLTVKRKEAWLRRRRQITGQWPSSDAAKQRGIGYSIWQRVVRNA